MPEEPAHPVSEPVVKSRRRRSSLLLAIVAAATVLVPFLFWKQTWFGEPLDDDQISEYLSDLSKPRHVQQALVQIEQRIEGGDSSAMRWYPEMAALKESPVAELRVTLAWVLGTDNRSSLFHETLLDLVDDSELLVRRNAALSLVRFGDSSGRAEILKMLQPFIVEANESGLVQYRLEESTSVEVGSLLARIEKPDGSMVEIRAPAPGTVAGRALPTGSAVTVGETIATLAPADDHVWEALRALLLVGRQQDLPLIERFANSTDEELSPQIREQASLTVAEIRNRGKTE